MSSGGVLEYSRGCWNSQLSGPSVSNAYTSCCSRSGEYTMNLTPRDQSFKWIVGGIVVIGFMAVSYLWNSWKSRKVPLQRFDRKAGGSALHNALTVYVAAENPQLRPAAAGTAEGESAEDDKQIDVETARLLTRNLIHRLSADTTTLARYVESLLGHEGLSSDRIEKLVQAAKEQVLQMKESGCRDLIGMIFASIPVQQPRRLKPRPVRELSAIEFLEQEETLVQPDYVLARPFFQVLFNLLDSRLTQSVYESQ